MNIIKILPNIFLNDNLTFSKDYLLTNNIFNIIVINYSNATEIFDKINVINIQIDDLINFNYTNTILLNILKKSNNILVVSNDNLLGFFIVSAFMVNYLKLSIFKILVLSNYYKIDILNNIYYNQLSDYYSKKI